MPKTLLITGASSGFGRDLARLAAQDGHNVVATARRAESLTALASENPERIEAIVADVRDRAQLDAAVNRAIARFRRLDVIVANAGYGVTGAIEENSLQEFRDQFETNVFGVLNTIQAGLPTLRAQGEGQILLVSSIAGLSAFAGFGAYSASKFAVEAIGESLAQEVAPFGIHVTIVEPGAFRTEFNNANALKGSGASIPGYEQTSGQTIAWLESSHGNQPGDPAKGSRAMLDLMTNPNPPIRLLLGSDAFAMAQAKLGRLQAEIEASREVAHSTDYLMMANA